MIVKLHEVNKVEGFYQVIRCSVHLNRYKFEEQTSDLNGGCMYSENLGFEDYNSF